MDFLHWLGFCPCNFAHLDASDLVAAFLGGLPLVGALYYKIRYRAGKTAPTEKSE
jgi:hypothetical protein